MEKTANLDNTQTDTRELLRRKTGMTTGSRKQVQRVC